MNSVASTSNSAIPPCRPASPAVSHRGPADLVIPRAGSLPAASPASGGQRHRPPFLRCGRSMDRTRAGPCIQVKVVKLTESFFPTTLTILAKTKLPRRWTQWPPSLCQHLPPNLPVNDATDPKPQRRSAEVVMLTLALGHQASQPAGHLPREIIPLAAPNFQEHAAKRF